METTPAGHIFMSGIGGAGMSAIAGFLAGRGQVRLSGSDRSFDTNPGSLLENALRHMDIRLTPQDGTGIDPTVSLMVASTAVEEDRPEVQRARALNIPIKSRPEYLHELSRQYRTIAVAGTSGKSTTSGMLAWLMHALGMQPNFIGGGRVKNFPYPGNFLAGTSDLLVIEACESDGLMSGYRAEHTIILSLDLDHHSIEETAGLFRSLMENTRNLVVINADDEHLSSMPKPKQGVYFSIDKPSAHHARDISLMKLGSGFTVNGTRYSLRHPGIHNIYNALSCIAMLTGMGVQPSLIAEALAEFKGIERRFDVHLDMISGQRHILVADDYAHNPHKISYLMRTTSGICDSVCYVFQPHGFGPTRMLLKGYIDVFKAHLRPTDHLVLLPIFYSGGTAHKDISSADIAAGLVPGSVSVIADRSALPEAACPDKECYIVFGARDDSLSGLASTIAEALKKRAPR